MAAVRHATETTLARLAGLLAEIRRRSPLQERGTGCFYLRGKALLHFHEDPRGLFADLKAAGDWERFPVDTATEHARLLRGLDGVLADRASGPAARSRQR
jgi:hypothetical protein